LAALESHRCAELLGLTRDDFAQVLNARNSEDAEARLKCLRSKAKRAYKECVMALHPDLHAGDAEKAKTLSDLNAYMRRLDGIKVGRKVQAAPRSPSDLETLRKYIRRPGVLRVRLNGVYI
jgi:hypothetical protein